MKRRTSALVRAFFRNEEGQGMTEYIIVVALIAIAAIGVVTVFGQNLRALFATSAATLGGETSATLTNHGTAGTNISPMNRSISNFADTQQK